MFILSSTSLLYSQQIYSLADVDSPPEYPGGDSLMRQYIESKINYPLEAQKKKIQGIVYLKVVIKKDGSIDNVRVFKSVSPLLEDEAIRVVKSLKPFKPALKNGKPVDTELIIPVVFKLKKE